MAETTNAHQPDTEAPEPAAAHPSGLFDPRTYTPDTLDFRHDPDARRYWIQCFRQLIGKFATQAAESAQPNGGVELLADATERAEAYRLDYVRWLDELNAEFERLEVANEPGTVAEEALEQTQTQLQDDNNSAPQQRPFTIRDLLEHNERLLRVHGFADPWRDVKRTENQLAIAQLASRLAELDALRANRSAHWTELFRGLFAGNVFDRGAQAVTVIREQSHEERGSFGLHEALGHIQQRPWLVDDLDRWLQRVAPSAGQPAHRCAAVFVDNSGADVVLGVLPFVRELLRLGTDVILCANQQPSLNDVTAVELHEVLAECGEYCAELGEAVAGGRLLVGDNGQAGPCLDMRGLSEELNRQIVEHRVDLLVIEGMGRALHTNYRVQFTCDTLKLAVVKNAWWAKRLGGENFAVICKFEEAEQRN